jgi:predicted nuclease of predicted toxin-antitoxin system
VKFYLDEDISPKIAEKLREAGVDAVSAHEAAMLEASDDEQLVYAAANECVLVTRNRYDFIALTVQFFENLQPHCGLIIVPHAVRGSDIVKLVSLLREFAASHAGDLEPYTVEFLPR